MRGQDGQTGSMFSYVDLEDRVPAHHPLRKIREFVNAALAALDAEFAKLYSADGRPSIAPERLLRAALIQILFSIRSERQLMEQMQYNLLFRWFVGLGIDDAVWVPTVFTKNRDRLLNTDIARKFLAAILAHKDVAPLLIGRAFLRGRHADRSLGFHEELPAQRPERREASRPRRLPAGQAKHAPERRLAKPAAPAETPVADKGRNAEVNFHGQKRSNETHASVTDPDARLYRKGEGKEAKLCYMGHALMENRNGLVVEACLTHADGHAERNAALAMIEPRADRPVRITLGADKGYDAEDFVNELRAMNVTPHVAAKSKGSAIDGRTTRHAGYAISQRIRKRIEEPFGWSKTVGPAAKTMLRGLERVGGQFIFTLAAYNLARLPKLLAA